MGEKSLSRAGHGASTMPNGLLLCKRQRIFCSQTVAACFRHVAEKLLGDGDGFLALERECCAEKSRMAETDAFDDRLSAGNLDLDRLGKADALKELRVKAEARVIRLAQDEGAPGRSARCQGADCKGRLAYKLLDVLDVLYAPDDFDALNIPDALEDALNLRAPEVLAFELVHDALELETLEFDALELEAREAGTLEFDALELDAMEADTLDVDALAVVALEIEALAVDALEALKAEVYAIREAVRVLEEEAMKLGHGTLEDEAFVLREAVGSADVLTLEDNPEALCAARGQGLHGRGHARVFGHVSGRLALREEAIGVLPVKACQRARRAGQGRAF